MAGTERTERTERTVEMGASGSLWRDRAFVTFWTGRAVSLAGTAITAVVLPVLVYRLTGSALATSLLATFEVIPYFVFGLVAGALADRTDRRRLMIGCDLLNMLMLGSIPVAQALGVLSLAQLFAVALLSASAFVWFDAANFGALPTLVGRERIVAANAAVFSMSTIVQIVGPAIAGVLMASIGPARAVSFDAASYLLSAVSLALIPRALNHALKPELGTPVPVLRRTAHDIGEGIRFIWRHRLVRALTLLGFGNSLTGGAVIGLLVVYAVQVLRLPTTDARIGLLFTAGALGSLPPSLLLPRLTARIAAGWITLAAMAADLALLLALAAVSAFPLALALYGLWEAFYSLTTMNGIALRQIATPEHLQGRVNATARMIAWGGQPFGAAIGGALAQVMGVRWAFLLMAVGVAASLAIGLLSPLRERSLAHEFAAREVE